MGAGAARLSAGPSTSWSASLRPRAGVIWMILLHPTVHRFAREQQCAVIEHVYRHLWSLRRPLVQEQDHLIIYRGRG